MSDSSKDKIKYGILKAIDISSFKVFDPLIRLIFGEEPRKQLTDLGKFLLLPILFCGTLCLIWAKVGPQHKTKSGEVPGPARVLEARADALKIREQEKIKEWAFDLKGSERLEAVEEYKSKLAEAEKETTKLQAESDKIAANAQSETESTLAPLREQQTRIKAKARAEKDAREEQALALSQQFINKEIKQEKLIAFLKESEALAEEAKVTSDAIKDRINEVLENPPPAVQKAQLSVNRSADEVQFCKRILGILEGGNKYVKEEKALAKAEEDLAQLAAATEPAVAFKEAKSAVRNQEAAVKAVDQKFAPVATMRWQTYRSLATVFVGFLLAALIAVPVGIMCGLNRVVMACMTPLISIFRPVSPVVWLLIFQIVVGAFFLPDPASYPLFTFMNHEKNPLNFLQTNPAMIFSACTVAMCALWPALVNTALGVSAIDKDHLNVAKVLKLGFFSRLFKIIIPSSLPLVFAGLRISLGVGWMVLIAAEALSSSDGLGKFVWDEYQNGSAQSFANIILACFVVGIIGFFLDRLMVILQRLVSFDDGSATA